MTAYETDFFSWTNTQSSLLKKRDFMNLDIENILEEIESLGRSDKRALYSHTVNVLMHLLKQVYQAEKDCHSWQNSIRNSSIRIKHLIQESPSLKNELKKIFKDAYEEAREGAAYETGLDIKRFPEKSTWEVEDIFSFLKDNK